MAGNRLWVVLLWVLCLVAARHSLGAVPLTIKGDHKYPPYEYLDSDNRPAGFNVNIPLQKKIFDPFFTTKPTGVGTELGLSISYFKITQTHNGSLRVKSLPKQGTCFMVRLPVSMPGDG